MNLREIIRDFIVKEICFSEISFDDDESLYELNILDSLGVFRLLLYLEDECQISIDPALAKVEDFETINNIIEFVSKREKTNVSI
jgi:acyl carrier protein